MEITVQNEEYKPCEVTDQSTSLTEITSTIPTGPDEVNEIIDGVRFQLQRFQVEPLIRESAGLFPQQIGKLFRHNRSAKIITLHLVTGLILKIVHLFYCFNTFGHNC